jgi:hypothetical protein
VQQRRGCRGLSSAGLMLLVLTTAGHAGASTSFTGRLYAHPRLPGGAADTAVIDRQVTVKVRRYATYRDSIGCLKCQAANGYYYYYPRTNSSGSYTYTTSSSDVACSVPAHTGAETEFCEYDPEFKIHWCYTASASCPASSLPVYAQAWASYPGETTQTLHTKSGSRDTTITFPGIYKLPHEVYGKHWARRLGSGSRPVFIIEGFDPIDANDSDYALAFLRKAFLNGNAPSNQANLHDYLTANGFSIWLILSGEYGGTSIAGRASDGTITDSSGLAYDAMKLIKKVRERHHPGADIVVGGYSMGGLVAKAGLYHWCKGDWANSASTYDLSADCPEVALWFAADAPLQGATLPASLQFYLKDSAIRDKLDADQVAMATGLLDSKPAQEMLKQRVVLDSGAGHCDTDCGDAGGCTSTGSDFDEDCSIQTYFTPGSPHQALIEWAGGLPGDVRTSGGTIKPGIAFSVGRKWSSSGNLCYQDCVDRFAVGSILCGSDPTEQNFEYLDVAVSNWGDHHLITNSAGGYGECEHGSKLSSLMALEAESYDLWKEFTAFTGYAQSVSVYVLPTFISSKSALGGSLYYNLSAHHYETRNYNHSPINHLTMGTSEQHPDDQSFTVPVKATGFLTAWIWEYLRGTKDVPICNSVRQPYGYTGMYSSGVQCRQASCGDGVCEGGEGGESCTTCNADCGWCVAQ